MRNAISVHERLSATLRFLATGRSYKDLEFTTFMSKQSLSEIIPETCVAIYKVLKNKCLKFPESEQEWLAIAADFERKWQYPHCLGSVDGKHIRIIPPKGGGSYYFNYKKTHSIVLMAVANANCEFIYCDVGTNGRISDGGVLSHTTFYEKLVNNDLQIPKPAGMPNSNEIVEYTFVGDEAFAMRPDLIKPYSSEALNRERRIFNYRLSRARRTIENTFGILASRFRIFHTAINLKMETIDKVVLTCCVLHNFLRQKSPQHYTPQTVWTGTILWTVLLH
ncbi:hypothetical protein JTB14_030616 [Gonioctena quinquepunctata]|nr:hypothetical protein JTB14_030616 [Gonioctena quinquepunctata]